MTGELIESISTAFEWVTAATVQGGLLVVVILLLNLLLRDRLTARWRYCLWLLLIVRIVLPVSPPAPFSMFNLLRMPTAESVAKIGEITAPPLLTPLEPAAETEQSARASDGLSEAATISPIPADIDSMSLFSIVWLVGAAGLALAVFLQAAGHYRKIRRHQPVTRSPVLRLLEQCKEQLGVTTYLPVVETSHIASPVLFGFVRPKLLLPAGAIDSFTLTELRYIFLHELAHLKRHDIAVNWLIAILQAIHWFNPLVWLAFWRMRRDRELACDALVLSRMPTDESSGYGSTILNFLERFSRPRRLPCMAGILEEKSQLKGRITMIAKFKKGSYRLSILAVLFFAIFGAVVLTNATAAETGKVELAKCFVDDLAKRNFRDAVKGFDAIMKAAMPAAKLSEAWDGLIKQAGPFQRQLDTRSEKIQQYDTIFVTCQFEHTPLDVKVVFDSESQISGLWFVPTPLAVVSKLANREQSDHPAVQTEPFEVVSTINEKGHKIDKVDYPFVSDREAIGSWQTVDFVADPDEFVPGQKQWKGGDLLLKKFVLQPNGTTSEPGLRWTKGLISNPGDSTAGRYIIKELDGETYMFFEWKTGDYTIRHAKPKYYVLQKAAQAARDKKRRSSKIELAHDNGVSAGRESITGGGHGVRFVSPAPGGQLRAVKIYGSRFGEQTPPNENFHVWLCDMELNVLTDFEFPYARFRKGEPRWVRLSTKPTELTEEFMICAGFDPHSTKGVYVHYDGRPSEDSFITLPGKEHELKPFDRGSWMIRAEISGPQAARPVAVSNADKRQAESFAIDGWRLWREQKLSEAEEKFQAAVEKDPTKANAWQGLGWAQHDQGKKLNAKHSFEQCLKLEPQNAAALNGLAWIAKTSGDTDLAIDYWQKAVAAMPDATAALSGLARTYMELGQYDKALQYYEMWLKVEPNNAGAQKGAAAAKQNLSEMQK